jgi:hypothetical protein
MFPGLQTACASLSTACRIILTHVGAWEGGFLFNLTSFQMDSPLHDTAYWRVRANPMLAQPQPFGEMPRSCIQLVPLQTDRC